MAIPDALHESGASEPIDGERHGARRDPEALRELADRAEIAGPQLVEDMDLVVAQFPVAVREASAGGVEPGVTAEEESHGGVGHERKGSTSILFCQIKL